MIHKDTAKSPSVINRARAEIAAAVAARKLESGEFKKDTIITGSKAGQPHPDGPLADDGNTLWRIMIRRSHPKHVDAFLAEHGPSVLDPFAGGGSIPLEAQRLGLRSYASDLNPVAVLINKALIELPPSVESLPPVHPTEGKVADELLKRMKGQSTFGGDWHGSSGLAQDVRYYAIWVWQKARERLGSKYPTVTITEAMAKDRDDLKQYVGKELPTIAWIWARTVESPNPAAQKRHVPLVSSFWLSKKKGKERWIEPVVDKRAGTYAFVVRQGKPPAENANRTDSGTKLARGCNFECLLSELPIPEEHIKSAGKQGQLGARLMAVVCEGKRSRIYLSPLPEHVEAAAVEQPDDLFAVEAPLAEDPRNLWCLGYGLDTFDKLFTSRQLTTLVALSDLVKEAVSIIERDAADKGDRDPVAYARAVSTYLSFGVGRSADFGNASCRWAPTNDKVMNLFSKQAIPMTWDFAEANPIAESVGGWWTCVEYISKCVDTIAPMNVTRGNAEQRSATSAIPVNSDLIVSADPPYYANIGYADLSDFFYVWLRRTLRVIHPEILATLLVPKDEELIAAAHRFADKPGGPKQHFQDGFLAAFTSIREKQSADVPMTVYYALKEAEQEVDGVASTGWETLLQAMIDAGFCITATWPVRAAQAWRQVSMGTNALASYIVLACRPRPSTAPMATRREVSEALRAELPVAIREMQQGNIAPVDLAQSSIGPGMAVFSRYSRVVNADGNPMMVKEALQLVNQVLDEVLSEQESDFDAETRFALKWFEQHGMDAGALGDAETLAKAMAVSVQGVVDSGVAVSKAGKVRLLKTDELDADWNPQTDDRLTIWEVTQHLIRELEQKGESAAAEMLRSLGAGAGQTARELAYRLYQTCERKKWAEWARSYNGLVVSWPEIERLSRQKQAEPTPADAGLFENE